MKKLSNAEIRCLQAFPPDTEYDGKVIRGTLCNSGYPKNTSVATVNNLYNRGLIEHSYISFYLCPMRLSEKGKKFIADNQTAVKQQGGGK